MNLGSHTLFAFEVANGEIDVVISLFGLLIYRVIVAKKRPKNCEQNFLFVELRIDSSRREITHKSIAEAEKCFNDCFNPDKFQKVASIADLNILIPKSFEQTIDVILYPFLFNMIKCFDEIRNDTQRPNDNLNRIFIAQLKNITQASTLQKKSIKRFVNELFLDGHAPIQINPHTSNKKTTVLFYAVYLVGVSDVDKLDDTTFQRILKEGFSCLNKDELIVNDEIEIQLKNKMLKTENYPEILEKGANIIRNWNN